jgi:predicted nucleic acid-binding protein
MWTAGSIRTPRRVPEHHARGLLDTSVVIDLERHKAEDLPLELAVSAVTMAELAAGSHATVDPRKRAERMLRLQHAEGTFDQLPFDSDAARAYGRIYAAVIAAGRKAPGRRALDLLIAATAMSNKLPLYTQNAEDFTPFADILDVVTVQPPASPPS